MELKSPPSSFGDLFKHLAGLLATSGEVVDTGHWQSLADVPQTRTLELRNVTIQYQIPDTIAQLNAELTPSDPWAELQFQERVAGEPTNPGKTYHLWPWFRGNVPKHQKPEDGDKFSHTYMERFWPRWAGMVRPEGLNFAPGREHHGIRYRYGDLEDVINLLAAYPFTRQAYLPIFFPEDTGAHHGERIPCTLGYHLMRRGDELHLMYPIRSCDFLRHFRDDVYMAARLAQWVICEVAQQYGPSADWEQVKPGTLTMHIHSLHVFAPEMNTVRRIAGLNERLVLHDDSGEEVTYGGAV